MTASVSLRTTLSVLMKDISEGLQLDRADRFEDAYRKYLECLLRITTTLLKKLHSDGGHLMMSTDLYKTVKLGQQCMDRVSAIVNDKFVPDVTKNKKDSMSLSLTSLNSVGSVNTPTTPSPRGFASVRVSTASTPSPSTERKNSRTVSQAEEKPALVSRMSNEKMSPMAQASKQNQQLLLAFKARQAQAQKRKDHTLSANLSLTLQRKMAENLAIAKAQEEALAKKMLQRQARLEEQAARRFGTPVGLSAEEQKQRQIYRRVLQFELEQPDMTAIKTKFEESPTDFELISQLLSAVLSCEKHPLTEQLKVYQDLILNRLEPLVCKKIPDVEKVTVPLQKGWYEYYKTRMKLLTGDISDETGKSIDDKIKPDESDTSLEEVESETITDDVSEGKNERIDFGISEKSSKDVIKEKGDSVVDDGITGGETGIIEVVEDIRKDIKAAEVKCDRLRRNLEAENESLKSMALYSAGEYDKYNQENMDDLFDEDDDDDSDIDIEDINKVETVTKDADAEVVIISDAFREIKVEAYKRHLKGIVEDILTSIEQMAVLFVVVYDKLDSAEGRDHCNAQLEASFFRPLWKYLLVLFRLSNASEELKLAGLMTDNQDCDPTEFNVRDELCLTPPTGNSAYPYEAAITELYGVVTFHTMLEKLECIVRTSKLVMQCVEQYYVHLNTQAPSIGADDLVPVLCYIVVRSGLPQIVSECQAVERFLHEGYMFGEEGYCLTSFQTAINYLASTRCQVKA